MPEPEPTPAAPPPVRAVPVTAADQRSDPTRWIVFLVAAALGLLADLGTKEWAFGRDDLKAMGAHLTVIPGFFDVALSENPGAAWGLLSGRHTFFLLISVAAFLAIVYFVQTAPRGSRMGPLILGLVFAGVAGNFYDRCAGGLVRDFIDWHTPEAGSVHDLVAKVFGRTHWPTFNVADVFICVGAAAIVLVFWREERRARGADPLPGASLASDPKAPAAGVAAAPEAPAAATGPAPAPGPAAPGPAS